MDKEKKPLYSGERVSIVSGEHPLGRMVKVMIGGELIPFTAIDIRIRADEVIEAEITVPLDRIDISTLQQNTRVILEGEALQ